MAGIKTIAKYNLNDKKAETKKAILETSEHPLLAHLTSCGILEQNNGVDIIRNSRFLANQKKKDDIAFCRDQQNSRLAGMSGWVKV